jgi:hypothetical protein
MGRWSTNTPALVTSPLSYGLKAKMRSRMRKCKLILSQLDLERRAQ